MRETNTPKRALVLGGKGFIGRHAVRHLERAGAQVTIGTRSPTTSASPVEEKHVLHKALSPADWENAAKTYDVILNCVGILRQRIGETYDAVHHRAPKAIALACEATGTRFVHVSALGLSATAKSRFLTSKHRGEEAIAHTSANWAIARISLIDGEGGYGAAWLRGVARLPIFATPASALGEIAPLTAEDTGEALAQLCLAPDIELRLAEERTFELGGEDHYTFTAYVQALRSRFSEKQAICIKVPGLIARLGAHLCDVFHFSPFSFGHWELLCYNNVPSPNRLPELLQRKPTPVFPKS